MKNLFNNDNNPCFGKSLPRPLTLFGQLMCSYSKVNKKNLINLPNYRLMNKSM